MAKAQKFRKGQKVWVACKVVNPDPVGFRVRFQDGSFEQSWPWPDAKSVRPRR